MDNLERVKKIVKEEYGITLYPVQEKAIKEMLKGNIINMDTGEGKTIVIAVTAIIKAMNGEKVNVITPNDYLNERDYKICKSISDKFNIDISLNGIDTDKDERSKRFIYESNIIYSTCSEFVFDYLRGLDMGEFNDKLLRNSIIIDEIDQILVDNSNTDYTISYGEDNSIELEELNLYIMVNHLIKTFKGGEITISTYGFEIEERNEFDFIFNKSEGYVYLTDKGENRVRNLLNIDINRPIPIDILSAILNTLNGLFILVKDVDYVVNQNENENELSIIDKNNGRYKLNNHYSSGINLALEIKERLNISKISTKERSINGLYLFSQFENIVGCSGTSYECKTIFEDILGTTVKRIKRNKKKNVDIYSTKYFKTKEDKYIEVINKIKRLHEKGLPILVIGENDNISYEFFERLKIDYPNVSNLVNNNLNEEEEIIKRSGSKNSILVSTLISGRGTDIKINRIIKNIGGLQVIFLSRFSNIRAEKQVIGRTGRQGDKGSVYMYSSLEDGIFKTANTREMDKVEKYIINNKNKKVDKTVYKLQGKHNRILYDTILTLYKKNSILNILNNYIFSKSPDREELKYALKENIRIYNLSQDKEYYDCLLKLKRFLDEEIKGGI